MKFNILVFSENLHQCIFFLVLTKSQYKQSIIFLHLVNFGLVHNLQLVQILWSRTLSTVSSFV
jgi:hypothetical protein